MKKLLLLFYFIAIGAQAQIINIPDPAFKAKLLSASATNNIAKDATMVTNIKIDTNNNGQIEEAEALTVYGLFVGNAHISDLTGIEKFTNVKQFSFSDNDVTTANLTALVNLEVLGAQNSPLLTSLNVSNLPVLHYFYCPNTSLTTLDFSTCPMFTQLYCKDNSSLTSLNLKNGIKQLVGLASTYPSECWDNCPNLSCITADAIEITALQDYFAVYCGNPQSIVISTQVCSNLSTFEVDKNYNTISPNPITSVFMLQTNYAVDLTTLKVYDVLGEKLNYKLLEVNNNKYTIDISSIKKGTYFVTFSTIDGEIFTKKILKE